MPATRLHLSRTCQHLLCASRRSLSGPGHACRGSRFMGRRGFAAAGNGRATHAPATEPQLRGFDKAGRRIDPGVPNMERLVPEFRLPRGLSRDILRRNTPARAVPRSAWKGNSTVGHDGRAGKSRTWEDQHASNRQTIIPSGCGRVCRRRAAIDRGCPKRACPKRPDKLADAHARLYGASGRVYPVSQAG